MRKEIRIILLSLITILLLNVGAYAEDVQIDISASSAVLLVSGSNEVLFEKSAYEKRSMASTTKIMSSIIAIESGRLDEEITVTQEMTAVEGTSMGLLPNDRVSVSELVYGMLLSSGNDAANATAITIAGSTDAFVSIMNDKAKQIGMLSTHFVTPSGLDADDHYSTAYDMALLGSYAIENEQFLEICSSSSAVVDYGNPPYKRRLTNHNKLLKIYDGAIGIKTGFTKKSGRCLVSAAERDGVTLICVTLNDADDWNDHKKLLDYGFGIVKRYDNYQRDFLIDIVGGKEASANAQLQRTPKIGILNGQITQKVYIEHFLYAPVKKNDVVGYSQFYYQNGTLADTVPIIIKSDIGQNEYEEKTKTSFIYRILRKIKGEKDG